MGRYMGQVSGGRPHGFGRLELTDGQVWVGQMERGWVHGVGEWRSERQHIYRGEVKLNERCGKGVMELPNGHARQGAWAGGELVRVCSLPKDLDERVLAATEAAEESADTACKADEAPLHLPLPPLPPLPWKGRGRGRACGCGVWEWGGNGMGLNG